jgi:hypothetical protein
MNKSKARIKIECCPRIYNTKVDSEKKGIYWALDVTIGRLARGFIYYLESLTGFHNDQA